MKYLTIDDIRQHTRIDWNDEDAVLELYGAAAEDATLNVLRRSYDEVLALYGEVPAPVRQATLLLAANSYQHREPASAQNMSAVPYAFDVLVKPYMRLADPTEDCGRSIQTVTLGSDAKILISEVSLPDGLTMHDVDFTVKVRNIRTQKEREYQKQECIYDPDTEGYVVLINTDDYGVGQLMLKVTFQIPDTDYPSGYSRQVVNINPYTRIVG